MTPPPAPDHEVEHHQQHQERQELQVHSGEARFHRRPVDMPQQHGQKADHHQHGQPLPERLLLRCLAHLDVIGIASRAPQARERVLLSGLLAIP